MTNLIILGSGRSGTSMAAGCFANAGYFMGTNLYEPRESNLKGFFESTDINLINELIMDAIPEECFTFRPVFHHRWTAALVPPAKTSPTAEVAEQIKVITRREPFCFKDPRFSYTLSVWHPYLPRDTAFICVFRDPASTALSLVREVDNVRMASGIPTRLTYTQALETWKHIYNSILGMNRSSQDWLFVHYNQILDGSAFEAMEALARAGIDRSFPEGRLNRSIAPTTIEEPKIQNVYAELCRLAHYPLHDSQLCGSEARRSQIFGTPHVPRSVSLPTISAVVLSKNGAGRLERCLQSIAQSQIASELVVCIDRATVDDSAQVARRFTDRVHLVETQGYIETSLSLMAALCSGQFMLRIDDDECLGGEWGDGRIEALARSNDITHFWTPRRWLIPPGGQFIASEPWFPDLQLRLVRNDSDLIVWPTAIHDPVTVKGRGLVLMDRYIDHYDLVLRSRPERENKCLYYQRVRPEKSLTHFYLWEDGQVELLPADAAGFRFAAERAASIREKAAERYEIGSEIRFYKSVSCPFMASGWSHPESWGTWSDGYRAVLCFPLSRPFTGHARLTLKAQAYIRPNHPALDVSVLCGNAKLADWHINMAEAVTRSVHLPASLISRGHEVIIAFHIRNPVSPFELGESSDGRLLGLGFQDARLDAA
jgi:hypothetical protein